MFTLMAPTVGLLCDCAMAGEAPLAGTAIDDPGCHGCCPEMMSRASDCAIKTQKSEIVKPSSASPGSLESIVHLSGQIETLSLGNESAPPFFVSPPLHLVTRTLRI